MDDLHGTTFTHATSLITAGLRQELRSVYTAGDFVAQLNAIFVAPKSNRFETPAISRRLFYARANSWRFHGDFIAAIS